MPQNKGRDESENLPGAEIKPPCSFDASGIYLRFASIVPSVVKLLSR